MNFRTFVIGLPEKQERFDRAMAHIRERGFPDAIPFLGINAELCGLATSNTYDVDNPGTNFRIGAKLTGIYLGHYAMWSMCNQLPDSHFLLFEDDVMLHENFKARMEQAIADTPPDFDFLFLGSCCCKTRPTTHVKGDVYDVRYPLCNHAMLVAKKCLPYVLATQRKCYAPVDIGLFFHSFPALKVYTQLPRSADQHDTVFPP